MLENQRCEVETMKKILTIFSILLLMICLISCNKKLLSGDIVKEIANPHNKI